MRAALRFGRSARVACASGASTTVATSTARRLQSSGFDDDDFLSDVRAQARASDMGDGISPPDSTLTAQYAAASDTEINLERLPRAPGQYEMIRDSAVFKWTTTARYARKITGPMREWAEEFQCRTGVHVAADPRFPERAEAGQYDNADDVEMNVFLFGAEKAVTDAVPLLKAMTALEPAYVRCGIFRRTPSGEVEWLVMRRINRERRPADIPAVSLKTAGKYSMLFENVDEAITRTIYEETGLDIEASALIKTNVFTSRPPQYYWRPNVHYFVAELPEDAEVLGPQVAARSYMLDWDVRFLRQSSDPMDREWATHADPKTGVAWMKASLIDELQKPVKLEDSYMATRYTPPPASGLQDVLVFN